MRKIKCLFLDTNEETKGRFVEIEDDLKTFYKMIHCRSIDIIDRKVDGKRFSIICDEEGLLDGKEISAIDKLGNPMLVGNLIFLSQDIDENGELLSLAKEDAMHILNSIKKFVFRFENEEYARPHYILTNCEY